MGEFADYAVRNLGVKPSAGYARFMDEFGRRLSEDPVHSTSWAHGMGNTEFVIGTTLAFRSSVRDFRKEYLVIGYKGLKTIIIDKSYEEIDEYTMIDLRDGSIQLVDSRGVLERVAESFDEWIGPELLRAKLREQYASNLTVVVFDDELKAEEARLKLLRLKREGALELEDAVVVVKEQDGSTRYHQMHKLARKGGIAGSITGLIVGSLLLTPVVGVALGAVAGAASASLSDVGISDRFIEELSESFKPGCSALFALVRKADPDRVAEEFRGFGGKVLVNSVSTENEVALQAILDSEGHPSE